MAGDIKDRTQEKLKFQELKLNTLLEITKAINNNLSAKYLFQLFESILRDQLNIGRAVLFSNDAEDWNQVMVFGVEEKEYSHIDVKGDLLKFDEITITGVSTKEELNVFDVIIPVLHQSNPLGYLLMGDFDKDSLSISPIIKHLPFIQTLANFITVAIENKRFVKENIEKERMKKELEVASEMQSLLFPSTLPNDKFLEVSARYMPHSQVGGDYYDYLELSDEEILFCMADVSGKGVSAALLMANFQANLRAMVRFNTDLISLVEELNVKVNESAKGEKFITLFIGKYNKKTRQLKYINAAHNPPVMLESSEVRLLQIGCTGVGMFKELPVIHQGTVDVKIGSVLVLYTDGIVELENEKEESFEIDGLVSVMKKGSYEKMNDLNQIILDRLQEFKGDMGYTDDIALMSFKFK